MRKERSSEVHSLRSDLQATPRVNLFQEKCVNYEPAAFRSPYPLPLQAPGPRQCTSSKMGGSKSRSVMYSPF